MPRVIFSPDAEDDVAEIGTYIARDNPKMALAVIADVEREALLLAEFPGLGQARDDLAPGVRTIPVGKYILIYRPIADGIEVVRVVHGARNLPAVMRRWRP
jgi:toxin ParE1/3/4